MKSIKFRHFLWSITCAALLLFAAPTERQYKIKAGFLYNFLLFAQWPEQAFDGPDAPIIIGILGDKPFGDLFDVVEGKPVNGRILVIKELTQSAPTKQIKNCHLLFICPCINTDNPGGPGIKEILEKINGFPVLTVGEAEDFIAAGGMINFVVKKNNVTFEINKKAADRSGIRLSSKLLRLAIRVIKD
jgi:hypothetical protein